MAHRFTEARVLTVCGADTFQRGRGYWKARKVLEADALDGPTGVFISSLVRGSRGRVYEQSVDVIGSDPNRVSINGLCSCPVGVNCKHVVAVLLHVLNRDVVQKQAPAPNEIENWLDVLKAATQRPDHGSSEQRPAGAVFCLLYLLRPDRLKGSHWLEVETKKVRLLKRGGYGKPASYALQQIHGYYSERFLLPADKAIARLLVTASAGYYDYDNHYGLEGEFGELALKTMVSTGRCHWLDEATPPLQLGSARQIQFEWEKENAGQRLIHAIEPVAEHIGRLYRLWYIDSNSFQTGPLEHPALSTEQAAALLEAPLVPEAKLEPVSRQLMLEVPEYELPTPVKVDIERIRIAGEKPTPHLRLHSLENFASVASGSRFHCAQLAFAYGPLLLEDYPHQPIAQVTRENRVYVIERDIQAECAAIDRLYAMDLRLLDTRNYSQTLGWQTLEWLFESDSTAHSALQWQHFIENDLSRLREQGWQVAIDENFYLRFEESDEWHAELEEEGPDWFSLSLGVDMDGQRINLLPTLVEFLSRAGGPQQLREYLQVQPHILVPAGEHRWLKLPTERLLPIFDTLVELYDHEPLDREGHLALSRHQGVQLGDLLNDPALKWHGADELRRLSERLRDFKGIQPIDPPEGFSAQLRRYQREGLGWLQFLPEFEFNGILADDMGLGKTVQALAHLLLEKERGRMSCPSLVIAPTSLMGNWRREAQRFAPQLKVLLLHGADRHTHFDEIERHDLILTTYPLLRRDKAKLLERTFHYVILDESQAIKNPKSQTTQVVYELNCAHRLCLTGTPMENHLGELWSMFHFLMPGFLGNLERFNRLFRNPIERQGDAARQEQLSRRVRPFLLRRTKDKVAAELPEKTEIIRTVTLQGKQRDLYETIRLAMDKKVRREISKKGLARSQIMILDALLKLRQACCDPRLLSLPEAKKVTQSAKLDLLMTLVPEMAEEGRRILLFSQFAQMLGLMELELQKHHIDYTKLTGQTRKRDAAIARFQEGDVPVFLVSLKAGGVGLNLTAADTVIHYDPWWNPAVENQATDRAHRIGQDKAVFVYKLITEETVEDKIIALQQKKQALAESIYSGKSKDNRTQFTAKELSELLKPLEP